jgi:hypothetical protein
MTPALGLEYRFREPVMLEARGTMTLSLDGLAGYAARSDVVAMCGAMPDGEGVSSVSATAIGTIDGFDVDAFIVGIELEVPSVGVGGVPTVNFKFLGWSGPVDFVERTQGGRDGGSRSSEPPLTTAGRAGPCKETGRRRYPGR